jgi:NitT/TauT family transport system substrate-binding protein
VCAALVWMTQATTDEIMAAVPPEYYGQDRTLYRQMIEQNRQRVSPDGRISNEAAERVLHYLSASQAGFKDAKIDLAATYDNTFVDNAMKAIAK